MKSSCIAGGRDDILFFDSEKRESLNHVSVFVDSVAQLILFFILSLSLFLSLFPLFFSVRVAMKCSCIAVSFSLIWVERKRKSEKEFQNFYFNFKEKRFSLFLLYSLFDFVFWVTELLNLLSMERLLEQLLIKVIILKFEKEKEREEKYFCN